MLVLPLQSQAEEQIESDQKINEVNVQEENKESQESSEQVETKQDEEKQKEEKQKEEKQKEAEQQEVVNKQLSERKIETEQGIITVNKPELKVGEEVRIAVEPNGKNIQSMKGILQLQKMGSNMLKKECYLLSMMKKRRAGLLTIKQGILICKVIGIFSSFKVTKRMRKKSS